MNLKDLKKQWVEESESQIQELPELASSEIDSIIENYEAYIEKEMEKPLKDRKFFEDPKGGILVLVRFPKKSDKTKNRCSAPKITKNGSIQWWGPKIVLMKGTISTIFFPGDDEWKKATIDDGTLWEPEDPKEIPLYLFRGTMKVEYKWISDAKGTYARSGDKILAEAKKEHPLLELNTIEDVIESLYSELDRFKYTFNANELLKVY